MDLSRRISLSWVGIWLVGCVALTAGIDMAIAAAPVVACSPSQPIVGSGGQVTVRVWISIPEGTLLRYFWTVEAGRVMSQGAEAIWDLARVRPSTSPYKAEVRVLGPAGMMENCALRVFVAPPYGGASSSRGGRETGRMLLPAKQPEVEGYGLYSYLLFGVPPAPEDRERYLQAIMAYLRMIPQLVALEKEEYGFKPHELNVIYLPILEALPPETQEVTPEWVLAHYDYTRVRALMKALPGSNRAGPYLVSTLRPLGQTTVTPEKYLFQDLSVVPPHLVSLWVGEFLNQAAQQNFWQEKTVVKLALQMRTTIAQLALAVPEVQEALKHLGLPDISTAVKGWVALHVPE